VAVDAKSAIKKGVKRAAMLAGPVFKRTGSRILTYHSVGERDHEMNVAPADFRRQMEWLANNCRVISFERAAAGADGVAVTFDDGYADNLLNAAPVLREFGIPATFFVVAGRAGGMLDHDTDKATASLMTWDGVRELHAQGFEIGCHTLSHPRLAQISPEQQREEIKGAKDVIEQQLGCEIVSFAYPFGSRSDYDAASVALVKEAGFCRAASNRYGVNAHGSDMYNLRRIWIDRTDSLETFQAKVDGRLDALAALDSRAGLAARRLLNRLAERTQRTKRT